MTKGGVIMGLPKDTMLFGFVTESEEYYEEDDE